MHLKTGVNRCRRKHQRCGSWTRIQRRCHNWKWRNSRRDHAEPRHWCASAALSTLDVPLIHVKHFFPYCKSLSLEKVSRSIALCLCVASHTRTHSHLHWSSPQSSTNKNSTLCLQLPLIFTPTHWQVSKINTAQSSVDWGLLLIQPKMHPSKVLPISCSFTCFKCNMCLCWLCMPLLIVHAIASPNARLNKTQLCMVLKPWIVVSRPHAEMAFILSQHPMPSGMDSYTLACLSLACRHEIIWHQALL